MGSRLGVKTGAAVAVAVFLAASTHHLPTGHTPRAAQVAMSFAIAQIGKPYMWGGTGPDAFDCSGLVQKAYAAAGVTIPRTSQQQWASLPHVSAPQPGDLVFFPGSDGTAAAPGHVGLAVSPSRHLMVEAYAAGYPIRYATFGLASSPPGDQDPAGYADPAG